MRKHKVRIVPAHVVPEHTAEQYAVHYIEYTCDGCGKSISREDHDDNYAHELQIGLDSEECVNLFRERDYCPACLEPVWQAISELIKADPNVEREEGKDE